MDFPDVLIVGAGVVGLSLADELSRYGATVRVIDGRDPATQASWAAAGIIPFVNGDKAGDEFRQLEALSGGLYPAWVERLSAETNVDAEYRECGAITLARSAGEAAALRVSIPDAQTEGAVIRPIELDELADLEPALSVQGVRAAFLGERDAQVRPPRLLKALLMACRNQNVEITGNTKCRGWQTNAGRITGVESDTASFSAGAVCITAGPWSGDLLGQLGVETETRPWRGQIALLRTQPGRLSHMIHEGPNYLVPRHDGRIVVGSTVEDVGYASGTTDAAIAALTDFAVSLVPALQHAPVESRWSGLRPGSVDGWPYLGRVPGWQNAYVATGHFRYGVALAPATALLMRQLISAQPPSVDLSAFRLNR